MRFNWVLSSLLHEAGHIIRSHKHVARNTTARCTTPHSWPFLRAIADPVSYHRLEQLLQREFGWMYCNEVRFAWRIVNRIFCPISHCAWWYFKQKCRKKMAIEFFDVAIFCCKSIESQIPTVVVSRLVYSIIKNLLQTLYSHVWSTKLNLPPWKGVSSTRTPIMRHAWVSSHFIFRP